MIRKLILTAVLAAVTFAGGSLQAGPGPLVLVPAPFAPSGYYYPGYPGHPGHDHRVQYRVLVRHHGHWDLYEVFRDREDARHAVRHLERRGYDARVEVIRGW